MNMFGPDTEDAVIAKTRKKIDEPSFYKVLLHNDDYTTMEFVVEILMAVFKKSLEESTLIMLNVHRRGSGVCGVFIREVAETKVNAVHILARARGFPLKCSMEKE